MKDVWEKNRSVYGARKLWHAMKREKIDVARCTVERLMQQFGIQGVRRGKKVKTTHGQPADQCPLDKVNRQFRASMPNELWGRLLWRHWFEPNGRRLYVRVHLAWVRLRGLRN